MPQRGKPAHRPAQRVVIPYVLLSLGYIFFSDMLLELMTQDPAIIRWAQTVKGAVFISATAVALYVMIYWQVQRLMSVERESIEKEMQFTHVFDYAVSGMAVLDTDGTILRVNDVLLRMLGYDRGDLIGQSVLDLSHPEDRPTRLAYLTRQLEGHRPETPLEVRYRGKDGQYVWAMVSSVLVRDVQGHARCFISQVVDVSERRRAEEEVNEQRAALAHTSRLITLGELAAGLTHELTQPLTAIGHYADVARRRVREQQEPVSETMQEAVAGIVDETRRAREIVQRWRMFARGQAPRTTPICPNNLAQDAVRLLGHEARREGIALRLNLQPDLPPVEADQVQIEQVLVNLIGNAIDALALQPRANRQVVVRTDRRDGGGINISVSDNGPGVDPTAQPRLFEPFFTTKPEGIGLGLSISRGIVQSHGGSLVMERTDGWTTFRFDLPFHKEQTHVAA